MEKTTETGKMESYAFADGYGNEINRGVQMWPEEAQRYAQRQANRRGMTVSYWEEGAPRDDDGVPIGGIDVEPETE